MNEFKQLTTEMKSRVKVADSSSPHRGRFAFKIWGFQTCNLMQRQKKKQQQEKQKNKFC